MTQGHVLIIVLIGVPILAFVAYRIMRFMRGSIKLTLPKTAFNPGDIITGSFELHTKREIEGNKLVVQLIGVEESRVEEQGKTKTRSREIYREEVIIEEALTYPAGHQQTYDFEIATPNMQTPEFSNSTTGQMLMGVLRMLGSRTIKLKWRIEVRLDAKGIDLATYQSVSINMISFMG